MQHFKKILLLYSDKNEFVITLKRALSFTHGTQAELTVLDVLEDVPEETRKLIEAMRNLPGETRNLLNELLPEELLERAEDKRRQDIEQRLQKFNPENVPLRVEVVAEGPLYRTAIRKVLREGYDLVMKTAQGGGATQSALFGSQAMHLLRKCPCPVWLVKGERPRRLLRRRPCQRIIAAVDFNDDDQQLNQQIMTLANAIACLSEGELHVVHAWRLGGAGTLLGLYDTRTLERLSHEVRAVREEKMQALLASFLGSGAKIYSHLLKGEADEVIPSFARVKQAELVVMGSLGRVGLSGLFIGNTAESVLYEVDCSVLAVKPEGFRSPIET